MKTDEEIETWLDNMGLDSDQRADAEYLIEEIMSENASLLTEIETLKGNQTMILEQLNSFLSEPKV